MAISNQCHGMDFQYISYFKPSEVGLSTSAESTLAATAAIKWVSKDGLGTFGRLLIGGRFGRIFDDDPKQWRMYADIIGSLGSLFELATPFMPESFLLLASLGNLTKAVARGLKDPSFRVIQNHFAASDNLGEIAAKEEVWEVTAQMVGLAVGVLLLGTPGLVTPYPKLLLTWMLCRSLHLWFRYWSLASLQFPTLNYKRVFILVEAHVSGSPIPGYKECNLRENLFVPWQISRQYIHLGCSLKDIVGSNPSLFQAETLLRVYANEKHVLALNTNTWGSTIAHIIFKEGATSMTVLRSIWQAQWILFSGLCNTGITGSQSFTKPINLEIQMTMLTRSLEELNNQFSMFVDELVNAGWKLQALLLKVPKKAPYLIDSMNYSMIHSLDADECT